MHAEINSAGLSSYYESKSIDALLIESSSDYERKSRLVALQGLHQVSIEQPSIEYGTINQPKHSIDHPRNTWLSKRFKSADGRLFLIKDAIIHGEQGIITVDNTIIKNSLFHAIPKLQGFIKVSDNSFSGKPPFADYWLDRCGYAMMGYVGNRGYAHWIVDVVPGILIPPFHKAFEGSKVLLPKIRNRWQRETIDLLPELTDVAVFVDEFEKVGCRELFYLPCIAQSDFFPHPHRLLISEILRYRAGYDGNTGRKIYISRLDTKKRRLINEREVINVVEKYGFDVIELSKLSLVEQIKTFASASHIIAPHGAGLANLTFCSRGAAVCELHMDTYVQWAMRRLANVVGLRYGCVIGTTLNKEKPLHLREWVIDILELEKVITESDFLRNTH